MNLQRILRFLRRKFENSKWFEIELFYSLPRTFETQVCNLLKEGFPKGIAEDRYCSFPYAYVLALEKGKVIGVAKLFSRSIVFKGDAVDIGGFGGVTTKKNRRRMGVATALLQRGMEDFRIQNFDIAFLGADVHNLGFVRLYGKVGFVVFDKPYAYIGKSGTKYVDSNGMVAPVVSMDKFESVLNSNIILDIGLGSW